MFRIPPEKWPVIFTRTKVHRATPQMARHAKSSTIEVKSSVQNHIGHIRTCSGFHRVSGQFLTCTKAHRASPQITLNAKSSTMEIKSCVQEHIGHIRTCSDMFRIPPGKWPIFYLNQSQSYGIGRNAKFSMEVRTCFNMFRMPQEKWPDSDMNNLFSPECKLELKF